MTNNEAAKRRLCLHCGEANAGLYVTTRGANPGRKVRVCYKCFGAWQEFGLRFRVPEPEEIDPDDIGQDWPDDEGYPCS